jgi:glycerol kinase
MILGIDQGTTGTTVIIFDHGGQAISKGYNEFTQHFPKPGWVEHDPMEILDVTRKTIQECVDSASITFGQIKAIGITNQRETTVVWDRGTGKPVHNAIVWQCRRTTDICNQLKSDGHDNYLQKTTGLVVDAYFSGTKIKWILDSDPKIRHAAEAGKLSFGTIDSWLIWNFTNGQHHLTDHTNASRTMIYNISEKNWDSTCMELLTIPESMLPKIINSTQSEIITDSSSFFNTEIPISGIAGDQQAALFGQQCVKKGMVKNTYGTGCFMLMYLGEELQRSQNGLLTTIACDENGSPTYAFEGSVFIGGAVVQWLRDKLNMIESASETEAIATSIPSSDGVVIVPAFVGLGAPHWNMDARGLITGLTRGTDRRHIIRAALESIALQSMDVFRLMSKESGIEIAEVRVDGGASENNFLMQLQSDLTNSRVNRPKQKETTVLGAAMLAGLGIGFWTTDDLDRVRQTDQTFEPSSDSKEELIKAWNQAIKQTIG